MTTTSKLVFISKRGGLSEVGVPHPKGRANHHTTTLPPQIHTQIVTNYMQTIPHNKILNRTPPERSDTKQALPHYTRRLLAQLRTNKSPILHAYLHKITPDTHTTPNCLCHCFSRWSDQLGWGVERESWGRACRTTSQLVRLRKTTKKNSCI